MKQERVIFRQFKDNNDVIAFLPDQTATRNYVTCYMFVGQHSEADYRGLLPDTRPVSLTHPAVIYLWRELESLGYKLKARKKLFQ